MIPLDTGICAPESRETLLLQQAQMLRGNRDVQMFPRGTDELTLPDGLERHENERGVFHFRPERIAPGTVDWLSRQGRENEYLNLGPYCKYDVAQRALAGEPMTCITEYIADVELRSACGTSGTIEAQRAYFERTKEPDGHLVIGELPARTKQHGGAT